MNRTTVSLIAGATALAAVTGFAVLNEPGDSAPVAKTAARLPVERTGVLCPQPSASDVAETVYTSFTPVTEGAAETGEGTLVVAGAEGTGDAPDEEDGKDKDGKGAKKKAVKPVLELKEPGRPATAEAEGGESPALVGVADGRFAPGWTVQQTTVVPVGTGRGLLGTACSAPDTDFWFPAASTAPSRSDYVHLTNPDEAAAVVDIELFGKDGALESTVGEGIAVPPRSSEPVLLSTLVEAEETDVTVHVTVRSGRVSAAVQALDQKQGGDWLAPAADPAGSLVLPGIPADATSARLVAFVPGDQDADLKVQLASPTGLITPAGSETLHVKAGMNAAIDLGDITRGEPGSLVLTPTKDGVPVVAAMKVVRGKDGAQETAFIPATTPVDTRASVADNRAKATTLALTAPGRTDAEVKVTASAGSGKGKAVTKTFTIKGGTTQHVAAPVPAGLKGTYALTVEPVSGGPVYASRLLTVNVDGVKGITVQTMPDDGGRVSVPEATQDLSVLQR